MMHPENTSTARSNVIPFPTRRPTQPPDVPPPAAPRAKRGTLTSEQYAAARVFASIVAGGYGGTLHQLRYFRTVEVAERYRLRAKLLKLADRLGVSAESFIYRASDRSRARRSGHAPEEWAVWPHRMFVVCVKLLDQRRREGRPDEPAERLARGLIADAERHEAAARAYKPDAERNSGATEARDTGRLAALRSQLDGLKEYGDITDCSAIFRLEKQIYDLEHAATDGDWPEYIDDAGGAS
jgi:hypothetical protein